MPSSLTALIAGLMPAFLLRSIFLSAVSLLFVGAVARAQVLDDAWEGRQQAAAFFQASLEKERRPSDWAGVIRELERCIELSPEPSWEASIPDGSGRWRRHYLPYFFLGRAYYEHEDCEGAVKWLSVALTKGEVCKSKVGDKASLEKLLAKCEQKGVALGEQELSARDLVRGECSKVQLSQLETRLALQSVGSAIGPLVPPSTSDSRFAKGPEP